jgi:hypothetical protein
MAGVIIAATVAFALASEKIHDHKEKKRALKAQDTLRHGLVEEVSTVEGTVVHGQVDNLPAYHKENPPQYHELDQHPAFRANKQSSSPPR